MPRAGLIPKLLLPPLSKTLAALIQDYDEYGAALLVTLYEIALAMLIACAAGILVGGLAVLRNLFLPIFTAWLGIGSEAKIVFAGVYGFFPVMLSTAAGIRTIDPQLLLAARAMGATVLQQIMRVIIPASIPTV